ncbi:MAG: SGNH/GDSL hydrolase family protein [Deltaproteobacteria bacterium]|nr:SGNH/GDSL hydrolase family protein [Deltaproteobacteria bacterium]
MRLFSPEWLELRMKELTAGKAYEFGSDQNWPVVKVNGKVKNFKPNSSFAVRHYEYDNKANIDELGGRRTKYSEGGKVVPFLGDSFTFGVGVEDQETYVSLLSQKSGIRFLNLGVPGSALHFQNDIVEMRHNEIGRPNLYIFNVFIGNDFDNIKYHYATKQNTSEKKKKKNTISLLVSINNFVYHNNFLKRSYTIQFFRQQIVQIINHNNQQFINPIFNIIRTDTLHLDNTNKLFNKELERLMRMATNLNFRIIFIALPDKYQVNENLLRAKAKYYSIEESLLDKLAPNQTLERNFRNYGIPFFDVSNCLMKNKQFYMLYYTQDNHFTKYGHEAVAECLEKQGFYSIVKSLSQS